MAKLEFKFVVSNRYEDVYEVSGRRLRRSSTEKSSKQLAELKPVNYCEEIDKETK
jgi:hypothetical protein